MRLWGGIEAGGTKFVCAVGSGPGDALLARREFPTAALDRSLAPILDFFSEHLPLAAIGIAAFGPLDLRKGSPTYGHITSTPKSEWANFDFAGTVAALGVPVEIDTDVNGAALAEHRWGAAQGLDTVLYITVGTGIGGGALLGGHLLHGLVHPEMGHIRIPHDGNADPFPGSCAFHGDCWEGLASGVALEQRWRGRGDLTKGQRASDLPADHPAWALEAEYLAHGLATLVCTLSPQRIIMGGGVMQQPGLLDRVRLRTRALLNGYVRDPAITAHLADYIVPPRLGRDAGVLGAIALAQATGL